MSKREEGNDDSWWIRTIGDRHCPHCNEIIPSGTPSDYVDEAILTECPHCGKKHDYFKLKQKR